MGLFRKQREDNLAAVKDGSGPPTTEHGADSGPHPAASEPGLADSIDREPQRDAAATRSVPSGFVCGATRANTRGTAPADSWSGGARPGADRESRPSLWVVVADGIGNRAGSAGAATVAVEAVNRFLAATSITVDSLYAAFHTASVAVDAYVAGLVNAGMDSADVGGTTLTLAALTGSQVVCLWAGDTPAWAINADGVHRLTPPRRPGPLHDWLGAGDIVPTLRTVERSENGAVLVGSDGLEPAVEDPALVASLFASSPHTLAAHLVARAGQRGVSDDITAAAAADVASPPLEDPRGEGTATMPIQVAEPAAATAEPGRAPTVRLPSSDQPTPGIPGPAPDPRNVAGTSALGGDRGSGCGVERTRDWAWR
jgi:serine/threonine protein phosphatase PrpC